ncbi:MAG: hypothetical protein KKD63_16145 [Proteobacteria bacterium]|nr:hypothetical protein [Pseudomonadota bacterium]
MILKSIQKVKLYELLYFIDKDLAEQQRLKACPFCNSPIHFSNYPRKPRGGPDNLPDELMIRHSFCCSSQACRKRVLPASCRFWGRKVYWGITILVIMTLQQRRVEGYSAGKLIRLFGISRHTLKRWMIYFKRIFPISNQWKRIKGLICFEISQDPLPGAMVLSLIERFESVERGLIQSLRLLLGGSEML